jgi:hypothetical protein
MMGFLGLSKACMGWYTVFYNKINFQRSLVSDEAVA